MTNKNKADNRGWLGFTSIVLLSVAAACMYGVLHDQVTARVCIEYFTVGHARIIASNSPTLLGLAWGVVASWWVGLLIGVPLAVSARIGPLPKLSARDLVRPLASLLALTALIATFSGFLGYAATRAGSFHLSPSLRSALAPERYAPFAADLWAHRASYAMAFVGGNVLLGWTWRRRLMIGLREKDVSSAP